MPLLLTMHSPGSARERVVAPVILVVDDEADLVYTVRVILAAAGYTIETASHGREALERIRARHFDLVITDLRMPEMTGEELIAALEAQTHRPPIMVMSAYLPRDPLPVEAVITKPFDPNHLLREVRRTLGE